MRIQRFLTIGALLTGLFLASGGSSICVQARSTRMPCCKSSRPCIPTGVRTGDCCRFVPPAAPQSVPAIPAPDNPRDARAAVALEAPPAMIDGALLARASHFRAPHPESMRGESPPLFLLHASFLI